MENKRDGSSPHELLNAQEGQEKFDMLLKSGNIDRVEELEKHAKALGLKLEIKPELLQEAYEYHHKVKWLGNELNKIRQYAAKKGIELKEPEKSKE
ncbi:MAG: hypothetical protein WC499_00790 [Patescibacteria group bacterium]